MTYDELKTRIAAERGCSKAEADALLDALRRVITGELAQRGEVLLPGLGKFVTSPRAARKGRNPATGETIDIPAGVSVRFRPARALKAAVA